MKSLKELGAGKSKKRIITIVAVIVILAAALYVFYNVNGHSLSVSDRETRVVVTGSMDGDPQPYEISTIPVNSLVVVKHLSGDELDSVEVGDVLAFTNSGRFTVHRVIEIKTDSAGDVTGFLTRGDIYPADSGHTESPTVDDVIGVVVGVSPTLGKIVHFVQSTSTVYLIMILVVIAVMISVAYDIIRARRSHA